MPLPRAATAAGLSLKAAEQILGSLGLGPAAPPRNGPRSERAEPPPKGPRRNWSMLGGEVVRLYEAGGSIRAVAAQLGLHQREVWRQLHLAGVVRRPRGTSSVVLSRPALERLSIQEQLSLTEVARRFEVSTEAVVRNLRSYGLPRRDRHAPLDRDTLQRLYVDQRLGVRAVGARLGVSADKVRAELRRCGIAIRRPGRPRRSS